MEKFNVKEFAKWHKAKYGKAIFYGDIVEYYETILKKEHTYIAKQRFESIVYRTMLLNNY